MEHIRKNQEKLEEMRRQYESYEMSGEQLQGLKQGIAKAKMDRHRADGSFRAKRISAAAAAAAVMFVLIPNVSESAAYAMSSIPVVGKLADAVTFRNYHHESERQNADIEVPGIVTGDLTGKDQDVQDNIKKSAEEINKEIEKITEQIITEFKAGLQAEEGYQEVIVTHEVLATTEDYFTLKLICYQGAGSGAEWDYFYTIDLNTGNRITLKDLFQDGADYKSVISENIKEQMRKQMAEDEKVSYWLDNDEIPEWNFNQITDETSFYLNQEGSLVICFNEGDVGPMSMGCVEFEIPDEAIDGIRK